MIVNNVKRCPNQHRLIKENDDKENCGKRTDQTGNGLVTTKRESRARTGKSGDKKIEN